ncbi:hypothetical protein [Hyphococcus luteus]|uniref:Uncharacterized protein n=1 Tax=Hyphococcus luteus TaxID=2058213 RepID=A0A2S7K737_9PROT|nr:hypothetical protein [Marinicaulis flavus]PQA88292.1 hypothetical protein CW354_08310 [Marinicaulis flavus]
MTRGRRITSRRSWRSSAAKCGPQTARIGGAFALTLIVQAAGTAIAQEAVWEPRRLDAQGPTEAEACRQARIAASDEARAHLGLNIKDCACRLTTGAPEDEGFTCRLDFEVLVRK